MSLDIDKLKNVKKADDKTTARCPACAADGHDSEGTHLVVFANGAFTCAKYPGDKNHNKEIFKLVGLKKTATKKNADGEENGSKPQKRIPIRTYWIPDSYVIMEIEKFGGG